MDICPKPFLLSSILCYWDGVSAMDSQLRNLSCKERKHFVFSHHSQYLYRNKLHLRGTGNSMATMANWVSNYAVSAVFLTVTSTSVGKVQLRNSD